MDTTNSNPAEAAPVATASAPEVTAAPAPAAPAVVAASAPVKTAPVATGPVEIPKTTGKTPGGWNRFAGYNPNEAKNKKNDRQGGRR
jgi:hypothetical protein